MKKCMLFCLIIGLLAAALAPGTAASYGAATPGLAVLNGAAIPGLAALNSAAAPVIKQAVELPAEEIRWQLSQAESSLIRIQMNGWAKINDDLMYTSELEDLAVESLKAMDSDGKMEVNSDETEQIRQTKITGEQDSVSYTITFQNGEFANGGKHSSSPEHVNNEGKAYETYVIADAFIYDISSVKETDVYAKLKELLTLFEENPCIRTTYTASILGGLTLEQMERISRHIFHGLQGKITEDAHDGGWISKTGYSDRIGCAMNSNGKQINLNVALRYNAYEDKTYVWLGTPVISIPY